MASDVLIVLQARMASTRLPGKVLLPLDGTPQLVHCIRRLQAADVGDVCVATTTRADDDDVARVAHEAQAQVVRGPVDDVLSRFMIAVAPFRGAFVIRATADNPAVDIDAARRTLEHLAAGADYVVETSLPYGSAVEGIRCAVLHLAHHHAREPYDREHVTPWIKARPDEYRVVMPPAPAAVSRPDLRLTVDTPADRAHMDRVLRAVHAGQQVVPLREIIVAADQALSEGADA